MKTWVKHWLCCCYQWEMPLHAMICVMFISWFVLCSNPTSISSCQKQGSRSHTLLTVTVLIFLEDFIPLVSLETFYTVSIQKDCILIIPQKAGWMLGVSVVLLAFLKLPYCLRLYRSLCNNWKHLNYGNIISWKSKNKSRFGFRMA